MSSDTTVLTQKEMFCGAGRSQQTRLRLAKLHNELFVQLEVLFLIYTTKDLTVQQEMYEFNAYPFAYVYNKN